MALLLESLEHVQQKQRLLHKLRQVSRTLVLRTSCIPSLSEGERSVVFGGSMSLTSCTGIEDAVRAAGWRITVPSKMWGSAEASPTIRHWRGRLLAANASFLLEAQNDNVLTASFDSIVDNDAGSYWSDGHHRLLDIVAVNPSWASANASTCSDTSLSETPNDGTCREKPCIVASDATKHLPSALRRLLAAPWLSDDRGSASFDDEAIHSALPADDNAIVDQLVALHSGKVPESAVGISAKVTELKLNPRRYFIYLANGHWKQRPPPHDAVAMAAAHIAHILQAPPLVLEWLQRLAAAVASGEVQMPHGFGFGVVRDAQRRLVGSRLYLQNGPYGALPDLPLQWPLRPTWNASAAQRLSELLDLAEPHLIAALEWTAKSNTEVRFRQYSRIDHGPSTRSAIALAYNVVTAMEQAKGTNRRAGVTVAASLRQFAMAAKADVEVMGSSIVTSEGTSPVNVSKVGLFMGKLIDSSRHKELLQLVQLTMPAGATDSVRAWLKKTAQAIPGKLSVVNVAFGLSSDGLPSVAVYQVPAFEESVCTGSAQVEDAFWEESSILPQVTTLVPDTGEVWPPPPEDAKGSIQLLMGQEEGDAAAFLRSSYQSRVVHVQRRLAPAHFENRLIDRAATRAALGMLASRGLLVGNARVRKDQQFLNAHIPQDATAETILDDVVARQNKSVIISLDALLEEHGGDVEPRVEGADAQLPSKRLRSLIAGLRRALGADIKVNLYLSAAGDTVLPPHTDKYDVFVTQLWGRKVWRTCVPRASSELSTLSEAEKGELREMQRHQADGCTRYGNEDLTERDEGELKCTERQLEPGDALYLPKGIVHAARTDQTAPAAHLTIAVPMKGRTWGDLLAFVTDAALEESDAPAEQRCAPRAALRHAISTASPRGLGWRKPLPTWLLLPWAYAPESSWAIPQHTRVELRALVARTSLRAQLGNSATHAAIECGWEASDAITTLDVGALLEQALGWSAAADTGLDFRERFAANLVAFLHVAPAEMLGSCNVSSDMDNMDIEQGVGGPRHARRLAGSKTCKDATANCPNGGDCHQGAATGCDATYSCGYYNGDTCGDNTCDIPGLYSLQRCACVQKCGANKYLSQACSAKITVSGACQALHHLSRTYTKQGTTASGAPYYKYSEGYFLYWDPDCSGSGTKARWIIGNLQPSTTALSNLNGRGRCYYSSAIDSNDWTSPPRGLATWRGYCSGSWTSMSMTIVEENDPGVCTTCSNINCGYGWRRVGSCTSRAPSCTIVPRFWPRPESPRSGASPLVTQKHPESVISLE